MNTCAPCHIGDAESGMPRFAELQHRLIEPCRRRAPRHGSAACRKCSKKVQQISVIAVERRLAGIATSDQPQEWMRHTGIVRPFPSGAS
jgi:hypothetical protein